jgi:hypothetical protein
MFCSSAAISLRKGTIASIEGAEAIMNMKSVINFIPYYEVGNTIMKKHLNTLDQLYARIMILGNGKEDVFRALDEIRNILKIKDTEGNDMIIWDTFDKICNDFVVEHK